MDECDQHKERANARDADCARVRDIGTHFENYTFESVFCLQLSEMLARKEEEMHALERKHERCENACILRINDVDLIVKNEHELFSSYHYLPIGFVT